MTTPKKILLLSKYPRLGASSRLRSLQYLPYLESNNFEITVQSLFDDDYLNSLYTQGNRSAAKIIKLYFRRLRALLNAHKYDLIWIEKEIFPYLPALAERLLRFLGKAYVADYDDAIFHNYDLSKNPVLRKILGHKIDSVMKHSSRVIAGNHYLADRAKAAKAPLVTIIPTVVDHTRYTAKEDFTSERPIIGWIGSPSTQKYVVGIHQALSRACQVYNARVMLVGATPQVVEELPGIDLEVVPWTEDSEADLIRQMDIGIMPLPDGPWEKGKCGYKLIQYMASSVPVIASPVGVNLTIVKNSQSGLLASTPAEWEKALFQLLELPEQRKAMGAAGRFTVESQYSLQAQAPILKKVFNETIDKH